jgi:hypothetical protein
MPFFNILEHLLVFMLEFYIIKVVFNSLKEDIPYTQMNGLFDEMCNFWIEPKLCSVIWGYVNVPLYIMSFYLWDTSVFYKVAHLILQHSFFIYVRK